MEHCIRTNMKISTNIDILYDTWNIGYFYVTCLDSGDSLQKSQVIPLISRLLVKKI